MFSSSSAALMSKQVQWSQQKDVLHHFVFPSEKMNCCFHVKLFLTFDTNELLLSLCTSLCTLCKIRLYMTCIKTIIFNFFAREYFPLGVIYLITSQSPLLYFVFI